MNSFWNSCKSAFARGSARSPRRSFSFRYSQGSESFFRRPLYQLMIGGNLVVFALWNTDLLSQNMMVKHFALSKATLAQGNVHTLFTYSFSHTNIMHLLFNMLPIYFFGRTIEQSFGRRRLWHAWLAGALCGALIELFHAPDYRLLIGSSSATASILSFFIWRFPHETIYMYFVPVPAWVLGCLYFGYSYWMSKRGGGGNTAHGAHLGGLLAGTAVHFATRGRL